MITKHKKESNKLSCSFEIEISDSNNSSFIITTGGNTDLYWIAHGTDSSFVFEIKENNDFYSILNDLFKDIKKEDNKNNPTLIDNTFSWISEDRPPEEANSLNITKEKDCFKIQFNKNPYNMYKMCAICFCNFGSYHQNVELLFMEMFNSLSRAELEEEPTK